MPMKRALVAEHCEFYSGPSTATNNPTGSVVAKRARSVCPGSRMSGHARTQYSRTSVKSGVLLIRLRRAGMGWNLRKNSSETCCSLPASKTRESACTHVNPDGTYTDQSAQTRAEKAAHARKFTRAPKHLHTKVQPNRPTPHHHTPAPQVHFKRSRKL